MRSSAGANTFECHRDRMYQSVTGLGTLLLLLLPAQLLLLICKLDLRIGAEISERLGRYDKTIHS